MQKVSNRYTYNLSKIKSPLYKLEEALKLLKETSTAKFQETVELHANLNINPKYPNQQLRATVTLPYGTGNLIKIAALIPESEFHNAEEAGAELIDSSKLILEISKGLINFDVLITTPEMMPKLAKLGRILGPKGLMPSPKSGTVTNNIKETILDFKKGKFEYKADKAGVAHIHFGKAHFSDSELLKNANALYLSILNNRPLGVKGKYFKSIFICSSMGPSIKVDLTSFEEVKFK